MWMEAMGLGGRRGPAPPWGWEQDPAPALLLGIQGTWKHTRGRGGRGGGGRKGAKQPGPGMGARERSDLISRPHGFRICPTSGVQQGSAGLSAITSAGSPRPLETTGTHREGGRAGGCLQPHAAPQPPHSRPLSHPVASLNLMQGPQKPNCSTASRAPRNPASPERTGVGTHRWLPVPPLPGSGPARTWPWGSR